MKKINNKNVIGKNVNGDLGGHWERNIVWEGE